MDTIKWHDRGESFPTDLKQMRTLTQAVVDAQKGLATAQRNLRRETGGMEMVLDIVLPRAGVYTCKVPLELDTEGNLGAGNINDVLLYADGSGEFPLSDLSNEKSGPTGKALHKKIVEAIGARIKKANAEMAGA